MRKFGEVKTLAFPAKKRKRQDAANLDLSSAAEIVNDVSACPFYSNPVSCHPKHNFDGASDNELDVKLNTEDNTHGHLQLPDFNEQQGNYQWIEYPKNSNLSSEEVFPISIRDFRSSVNGHCFLKSNEGEISILVSMLPSCNLVVRGCAIVDCLLGSITVLGYSVEAGDSIPIFAPECGPPIIVHGHESKSSISDRNKELEEFIAFQEDIDDSIQGRKIDSAGSFVSEDFKEKLMQLFISNHGTLACEKKWDFLKLTMGEPMVVLRLREFPLLLLTRAMMKLYPDEVSADALTPLVYCTRAKHDKTCVALSLNDPYKYVPTVMNMPLYVPPSWIKTAHHLASCLSRKNTSKSPLRVLVIGAPRTGKKTFTRYLINCMLERMSDGGKYGSRPQAPSCKYRPFFEQHCDTAGLNDELKSECIDELFQPPGIQSSHSSDTKEPLQCSGFTSSPQTSALSESPKSAFAENSGKSSEIDPSGLSGVCVLDANISHPMQSLPGAVSLARYTEPVFGQAFEYGISHILRNCDHANILRGLKYKYANLLDFVNSKLCLPQDIKSILIGKPCLLRMRYEYIDAIKVLCQTAGMECSEEPLIINFASTSDDYELRLLTEIVNIIKPTHVVHISGHLRRAPRAKPLNCHRIDRIARMYNIYKDRQRSPEGTGVCCNGYNYWPDDGTHDLHEVCYDYARIPSVFGSFHKYRPATKLEETVVLASYFNPLWPYYATTLDSRTLLNDFILGFDEIAIEILFHNIAPSHVMDTLVRRGIVALCSVDQNRIRSSGPGLPKVIVHKMGFDSSDSSKKASSASTISPDGMLADESSAGDVRLTTFSDLKSTIYTLHGWAVVRGVDTSRNRLHILVPRCFCPLLDDTVNALVLPAIFLPPNFDRLFYDGYPLGNFRSLVPRGPWNKLLSERKKKR